MARLSAVALASSGSAKPAIPPISPALPPRPLLHLSLERREGRIARKPRGCRGSDERTRDSTQLSVVVCDIGVHGGIAVSTGSRNLLAIDVVGPAHVSPPKLGRIRWNRHERLRCGSIRRRILRFSIPVTNEAGRSSLGDPALFVGTVGIYVPTLIGDAARHG